jgi:hypothetical protein
MIARTDGRFFICSFCSVFRTLLHHVSHKIPAVYGCAQTMASRYDEFVRRLLQLGFFLLVTATFLPPLAELFDRWDAPGLDNDTEFALFAIVFTICLVLLVCKLNSSLERMAYLVGLPYSPPQNEAPAISFGIYSDAVIPHTSPPLRI